MTGVQDDTATLLVLLLPQVVVFQSLPASPVIGVQEAAGVGPLVTVGQVVVVQLLPGAAVIGTQLPEGVFGALLVEHTVAVQELPLAAAASVHEATGTLVVTTEAAQLTVTQLLTELPVCGVQVPTGTLLALLLPQVVVV